MTALADLVTTVVGEVLHVPAEVVRASPSLFDLPGFDSIAVVAVLDRVERELAIEVPADLIMPEAFDSVDSLTALLTATTTWKG